MKIKKLLFFVPVFCLVIMFVFFNTASASFLDGLFKKFSKDFSGCITLTTETRVNGYKSSTYTCDPVETLEINSYIKGAPTKYAIKDGATSKSGNKITTNKQIAGKYQGKKKISCTNEVEPWDTQVVTLDEIKLYDTAGTCKQKK